MRVTYVFESKVLVEFSGDSFVPSVGTYVSREGQMFVVSSVTVDMDDFDSEVTNVSVVLAKLA